MGFSQARQMEDGRVLGGYARIWAVTDEGKYSTVELSTSRKNQEGKYETDFANKFVRFVGAAHEMAKGITDSVSIQIKSCDVTRYWSKEKQKEYINFTVFDFDFVDPPKTAKKSAPKNDDFMSIPDGIEDELPWG